MRLHPFAPSLRSNRVGIPQYVDEQFKDAGPSLSGSRNSHTVVGFTSVTADGHNRRSRGWGYIPTAR